MKGINTRKLKQFTNRAKKRIAHLSLWLRGFAFGVLFAIAFMSSPIPAQGMDVDALAPRVSQTLIEVVHDVLVDTLTDLLTP